MAGPMMMTVAELLEIIDRIAPFSLAEDWDNVGLMLGSPESRVTGLVFSLEPDQAAIETAVRTGADCLVCHHPLIFKPVSRLDLASPVGQSVELAIRAGLNILAAHTNWDAAPGGVSDVLAERLDLTDLTPLLPAPEPAGAGLGRVGDLAENIALDQLADRLKAALGLESVRVTGPTGRPVGRVAVCGGSGGGLVSAAVAAGAEALVTGELGYHDALDAQALGLGVIAAGHYATEWPAMAVLADRIITELKNRGASPPVELSPGHGEPFRTV